MRKFWESGGQESGGQLTASAPSVHWPNATEPAARVGKQARARRRRTWLRCRALAREAIERFLDYDAWFLQEVNKGLAAADRGDFIEHDDVRKLIDSRYPD